MAGFFQSLLKDATTGIADGFFGVDYLRDYDHANKIFRSNSYGLAPKYKFLFHVYFEINQGNYAIPFPDGYNLGVLVKTIKLPSYSVQQQEYNQYNRKRLVQTKIKYDNIDITWHDDHSNLMRTLWFNYYTYYYGDSLNGSESSSPQSATRNRSANTGNQIDFTNRSQYKENNPQLGNQTWGYYGETVAGSNSGAQNSTPGIKPPFFKNIYIFGFSQHKVSTYVLINPMITTFGHDTYAYSEGNGVMENRMSLSYEFVKYSEGAIDGKDPSQYTFNFASGDAYDRRVSPIAMPGANQKILGQGGLVDAAGGFMKDVAEGNILGAIRTAGTAYNTFKNGGLKKAVQSEIRTQVNQVLTTTASNIPRNVQFAFNRYGQTGTTSGTAGAPNNGTASPSQISRPQGDPGG